MKKATRELAYDYDVDERLISGFLKTFEAPAGHRLSHTYLDQLQEIADGKSKRLSIDLNDLKHFEVHGQEGFTDDAFDQLALRIRANTWRYMDLFENIADELLPKPSADAVVQVDTSHFDFLRDQRVRQQEENRKANVDQPEVSTVGRCGEDGQIGLASGTRVFSFFLLVLDLGYLNFGLGLLGLISRAMGVVVLSCLWDVITTRNSYLCFEYPKNLVKSCSIQILTLSPSVYPSYLPPPQRRTCNSPSPKNTRPNIHFSNTHPYSRSWRMPV